jgi:septal ring factor EnvC (AmiA/AmiB activator)
MARGSAAFGVLTACLIVAGFSAAQDNQPARPVRGNLPAYYKRLGLTDEQRQQVLATRAKFQGRIDDLTQQIRKLRREERREMEKVLTPAQKARLREIIGERAPAEGRGDAAPTTRKAPTTDKK